MANIKWKYAFSFLVSMFTLINYAQATLPYEQVSLKGSGWNPYVKMRLEELIREQAQQNKVAVFDFDNTILCQDIGEATFAQMVKDKVLTQATVPQHLHYDFTVGDKSIKFQESANLLSYYESLLRISDHQASDGSRDFITFDWLVQIMAGLSPNQVIEGSRKAYDNGSSVGRRANPLLISDIEVTADTKAVARPHFQPEMVELIALLLNNGFDVWVVSASNVWTVRYMVLKELNQKLAECGAKKLITGDHVLGVSVLLKGKDGCFYKDPNLARENTAYANLDPDELAKYELTDKTLSPITGYMGKVANIMQWIGEQPYLVAGDSANDLPMLNYGENKLWIAQLEKTSNQKRVVEQIMLSKTPEKWLLQPAVSNKAVGFVPSLDVLHFDSKEDYATVAAGVEALLPFLRE